MIKFNHHNEFLLIRALIDVFENIFIELNRNKRNSNN